MVSEVATARLTAQQVLRDRFVGSYATVLLADAEKAAGVAVDDVATLQPPRSRRDNYAEVTQELSDVRIAVVDHDRPQLSELVVRLRRTLDRLHRLENEVGGGR